MKMPVAVRDLCSYSKLAVPLWPCCAFDIVPTANAVTFSTSGAATMHGLGDTLNTQFDVAAGGCRCRLTCGEYDSPINQLHSLQELMRFVPAVTHYTFSDERDGRRRRFPNVASAI